MSTWSIGPIIQSSSPPDTPWCRDKVADTFGAKFPDTPFPDVQEAATEAFAAECERFMKLLGSAGKA